jgi:Domain of unknown function DUF29
LAEEVEDLGSEQQWSVESQLERIIEHLLELEHSPNGQPRRQWMISVVEARGEIERRLTATIRREVRSNRRSPSAIGARGEKLSWLSSITASRMPPAPCLTPAPMPSPCSLTSGGR